MNTLNDFRRAFAEGEAMSQANNDSAILGELGRILTRCDDLDAMCAADGRLDPNQVRIDAARIREIAEKARLLVVGMAE